MSGPGDLAPHYRDGEYVIKVLDARHPAGARFVTAAQAEGRTGMGTYLSALRAAGVTLPPDLAVVSAEPLAVRHRWVNGPVLLDYASVDPPRFIAAVTEIARWVNALATTDARLDTNLANFCLAEGGLVLVDVLPPLIPSISQEPANLFEALFTALCLDTPVIHDALIGYAARALLRSTGCLAARHYDDLARQARPAAAETASVSFPALWFRARATLALRALAGALAPEVAHEFFALTSVRAFRGLPEAHRAHRIQQVEQAMTTLALT